MTSAIETLHLTRTFAGRVGQRDVHALTDVSLSVASGETLGIVGESGCGKSTLARLLVRLDRPSSGRITLHGDDVTHLSDRAFRPRRRDIQMVFQDPYGALNPRLTVEQCIGEVLDVHGLVNSRSCRSERVAELLNMVGMGLHFSSRLPRQLSGGQLQRIGIARALAVEPSILVLDEAVSALDVSVQAEVVNLLVRLREELQLTYIFISHDLGVIRHISDRIAVMYLGRVVEIGPWKNVSDAALHPYAWALHNAVPAARPVAATGDLQAPLQGEVPDPAAPPTGCAFHPRCELREAQCTRLQPQLVEVATCHRVACHVIEQRL